MKTNFAVEKINPSILILAHKKDPDNMEEDKSNDVNLCHMLIDICVCERAVSFYDLDPAEITRGQALHIEGDLEKIWKIKNDLRNRIR